VVAVLATAVLGVAGASALDGGGVVDGYVTDVGHGYPLYAHVELKQGATQVAATFTSPFTGYFELSVGDGSYDLVVTSVYAGYEPALQAVTVAGVDQTVGVVLGPDAACQAQGYVDDGGCVPIPGGLVAGFVTDGNNGAALVGAEVADDLGGSVVTEATGDDEAIGDGFYALFTSIELGNRPNGPAMRTYTATMEAYAEAETEFLVVPNTVSRLDFALPAGLLSFTPASLKARLNSGQETHQDLTLVNSGTAAADFDLLTLPVGPVWPHRSPVGPASAHPMSVEGTSFGPAPTPLATTATTASGARVLGIETPAYGVNLSAASVVYWPDLDAPHVWTPQGAVAGTAYSAGDFRLGDFSTLWVLDMSANDLRTVNVATGTATVVGSAAPVTGQVWTGMTASVNGTLYAASTNGTVSTLYTIDPVTAAVAVVGGITNAPAIIDIAIDAAGQMYGVDILLDQLISIDPATGAGTVVGALGVDANYAQGMDFDESSGVLYWAAYTTSSGELRTIDTATGASTLVGAFPGGAEVDCLAVATYGGSGLPWLVLTPAGGTVAGASSFPIDAHFIADGAAHFGLHRGTVRGVENTPYALPDVPVCFTKAFLDVPEGSFGDAYIHAIAGAQITAGCGGGNFCPNDVMTRGSMAPWLLRARFGSAYAPPACTGIFSDVPCSDGLAPWIEALFNEGITGGCYYDPGTGERRYCPSNPVLRSQMAVFLLKAKEGSAYVPPACTGVFGDVPCPSGFAVNWIEEIYDRGITAGCGGGNYCPDQSVSRSQMAVFVTRNWDLPTCQ
jgi:hypothetical protein